MNELDLKELWRKSSEKFEENSTISRANSDNITRLMVHNFLSSMKPLKTLALLVGILWVVAGAIILGNVYLYDFWAANKFFLFSATIQVVLTAIAIWIYLYQLIKIHQVNIYASILETQEKLVQLRVSTLWSARILFLQLPVWTTFWWNKTMFLNWNVFQWIVTIAITCSFLYISIWLFMNIKYKNRNTKWFQFIFYGKEWTPLMKSMELLEQVNDYK